MIRRIVCHAAVGLCLVIAAILASDYSFAQVQETLPAQGTPHLIFSTYLGGLTPCASCADDRTFAQNAGSDAQGNTYVTGGTRSSTLPVLNAWQPRPACHRPFWDPYSRSATNAMGNWLRP